MVLLNRAMIKMHFSIYQTGIPALRGTLRLSQISVVFYFLEEWDHQTFSVLSHLFQWVLLPNKNASDLYLKWEPLRCVDFLHSLSIKVLHEEGRHPAILVCTHICILKDMVGLSYGSLTLYSIVIELIVMKIMLFIKIWLLKIDWVTLRIHSLHKIFTSRVFLIDIGARFGFFKQCNSSKDCCDKQCWIIYIFVRK